MQATPMQKDQSGQKSAYMHFASRFPFPLNPIFFGQTFVIGNLTAASRFEKDRKNFVFLRDAGDPMTEPLLGPKAQALCRDRFNAELRFSYGLEAMESVTGLVRQMADEGYHSNLVFHFPVTTDTQFAYELRSTLERTGLDRHSSIIFYLHTDADSHYHSPEDPSFSRFHIAMAKASDGIIGVSKAVRDNFVSLSFMDQGREVGLDPARSFVVRNGIDPHIYNIKDETEIAKARGELGLDGALEKVVSFVGRMDRLKGSDYLVKVLEYFEGSRDPQNDRVGFVIGTSHVLNVDQASKPFKGLLRMKRLITEGRLKVVLDISKYTRGDPRFREDVSAILGQYASRRGLERALADPLFRKLYGGMTNTPVQTISDIYLHPSRSEAFGLSVLEGVFGGAYVIATSVGGIPEIIVDKRLGRLVTPSDKNTIVDKLISGIRGAERKTAYDRSGLKDYFASYTDVHMFKEFERYVRQIRGLGG
ncbi:MAG: glycosyltransferase [Candidatus Micrarchaeia archaeon]